MLILGKVTKDTCSKVPGNPLDGLVIGGVGYTTINP
jgi:hypothetical protein